MFHSEHSYTLYTGIHSLMSSHHVSLPLLEDIPNNCHEHLNWSCRSFQCFISDSPLCHSCFIAYSYIYLYISHRTHTYGPDIYLRHLFRFIVNHHKRRGEQQPVLLSINIDISKFIVLSPLLSSLYRRITSRCTLIIGGILSHQKLLSPSHIFVELHLLAAVVRNTSIK